MGAPDAVGPLLGVEYPYDIADLSAVDKVVILERSGALSVPGQVRPEGQGMYVVAVNEDHVEPAENTIVMLSQPNMRAAALSKLTMAYT